MAEFQTLLGKNMTVMQIRDFLSGEFTPISLGEVMATLKAREAAGLITLSAK
jgi:aminopeptidase YwaD